MAYRGSLYSFDSQCSIDQSNGKNMYVLPPEPLQSNIYSPTKHEILMDKPQLSGRRFSTSTQPTATLKELIPTSSAKINDVDHNREIWDEAFLSCAKPEQIALEIDLKELLQEQKLGIN